MISIKFLVVFMIVTLAVEINASSFMGLFFIMNFNFFSRIIFFRQKRSYGVFGKTERKRC